MKSLWLIVLLLGSQSCFAGVYRCQVNGKTVYQDAPCDPVKPDAGRIYVPNQTTIATPTAAPVQAQAINTPPTPPIRDERAVNPPAGLNSMSGSLDDGPSSNGIGMSAERALRKFGQPHKINRTTTASGVREQWVYDNGQYVYVENGKVTAIQESGGQRR